MDLNKQETEIQTNNYYHLVSLRDRQQDVFQVEKHTNTELT
jgi:hypothetical protein